MVHFVWSYLAFRIFGEDRKNYFRFCVSHSHSKMLFSLGTLALALQSILSSFTYWMLDAKSIYSILRGFCIALNRSKPPMLCSNFSLLIFFPRIAFGPDKAIFSMCWCCDRTAKRFTCTGIGTTILFAPEPLLPPEPRLMPCDVKPAFTRFHFARRFWNQIFTCNV